MNEHELLQAARQEAEPSDEQRARVAAALAVGLAAGGGVVAGKSGFLAGTAGKLSLVVVALVLAGGAGLWWRPAPRLAVAPPLAAPPRVPAAPSDAGPSLPVPPPVVPALAPVVVRVDRPVRRAAPAARSDLAGELDILSRARRALRAGDARGALAALDEHARRFPGAQLREEASALRVRVLCAAGRAAEARVLAEDFLRTWPGSPQAPGVSTTCTEEQP